jgi:outer membrane protein assembly factor BamB
MIRRLVVVTLTLLACHAQVPCLHADPDTAGLIPASAAEQCGLERVWFTQTRVLPVRGETPYLRLHVSLSKSQTIAQVTDQHGQKYNFSERNLNTFGEPLGVEGAKQAANEKVRLLKLNGVDATVETQVVPDITLYVAGSGGIVQAVDAETGRMLWSTPVGRSDYFTTSLAASDDFVAIVNGQHLFLLSTADGSVLEERRMAGGVPAAGPAILGKTVFVPMLNGQLQTYQFGPGAPRWPSVYRSKGVVRFPPTAVGALVLWPTDAGMISAIDPAGPGAQFRLQLDDPIAGPLVYAPPRQILAVTRAGYLYSFDAKTGGVMWRYSSGNMTAEPASVVNDTVFVASREAGMRAVATATGEEKWWAQGVNHFIAATKDRIYASTGANVLMVLDAQTGKVVAELALRPKDRAFVNNQTDRLYIGTDTGLLQCLRQLDAYWPTVHVTGGELAAEEAAAGEAEKEKKPGAKQPADEGAKPTDPFAPGQGDNVDPFGGKPAPGPEPAKKEPAAGPKPAPNANPFEPGGGDAKAKPAAEADEDGGSEPQAEAEADAESEAPAEAGKGAPPN